MSAVPIIDLSPFDRDAEGRALVAAQIADACERVGFFTIVGHGVPTEVVAAMWDEARAFFDLPDDDKRAVAMPYPGYPYGWSPMANETLSLSLGDAAPPDLKESYAIGPLDAALRTDDPDEAWVFSENLWPPALPTLRPAWERYYRELGDLAARVLRICAVALSLPDDHFEPLIDRHTSAMRAINYPAVHASLAGQLRAGAHTDYGTLTILLQEDKPGGLEVRTADDSWAAVPAIPDAFVVNLGDAMERWTNDRWRSTLHRVVLPPEGSGDAARRQSVAYFHNANWDAVIECIPSCLAPGKSPRYAPIAAGPHLMSKFTSTVVPRY